MKSNGYEDVVVNQMNHRCVKGEGEGGREKSGCWCMVMEKAREMNVVGGIGHDRMKLLSYMR